MKKELESNDSEPGHQLLNTLSRKISNVKEHTLNTGSLFSKAITNTLASSKQVLDDSTQKVKQNVDELGSRLQQSLDIKSILPNVSSLLKKINLEAVITGLKAIPSTDPKVKSSVAVVVNILNILNKPKTATPLNKEEAASIKEILAKVNLKDVINTLDPFISMVPFGAQVLFILKFFIR